LECWNGAAEVDDDFGAAGSFEGRFDDGVAGRGSFEDCIAVGGVGVVPRGMEELLRETAVDIGFSVRQKKEKVTYIPAGLMTRAGCLFISSRLLEDDATRLICSPFERSSISSISTPQGLAQTIRVRVNQCICT
jgi:hypothetical protein